MICIVASASLNSWSHEETGNAWTFARDRAVAAWCREHDVTWNEVAQTGVVRRLKSRDGWAKRWDRLMAKPIVPTPERIVPVDGLAQHDFPEPGALGLAPTDAVNRKSAAVAPACACWTVF